jgi:hypothetical protein
MPVRTRTDDNGDRGHASLQSCTLRRFRNPLNRIRLPLPALRGPHGRAYFVGVCRRRRNSPPLDLRGLRADLGHLIRADDVLNLAASRYAGGHQIGGAASTARLAQTAGVRIGRVRPRKRWPPVVLFLSRRAE